MLSLNEISKFYPAYLHKFKNFMLREYLQYKILEIIFESQYANKLCFLGGTSLRIVHNNTRFSKDLDFDNFNLKQDDFEEIAKIIQTQLTRQAYEIEIKNVFAEAFHCYIKFPKLLFNEGIYGHVEEKILIQLDTEPQHFDFIPENYILNKFDVFTSINITPSEILLAQKFYALINRPRKKGRDFFDIVFLLQNNFPNYNYLKQKLNINNQTDLKEMILKEIDNINLDETAKDIQPFLFDNTDVKKIILFKEFIVQKFN